MNDYEDNFDEPESREILVNVTNFEQVKSMVRCLYETLTYEEYLPYELVKEIEEVLEDITEREV